jgi:hypothetical protein
MQISHSAIIGLLSEIQTGCSGDDCASQAQRIAAKAQLRAICKIVAVASDVENTDELMAALIETARKLDPKVTYAVWLEKAVAALRSQDQA